MSAQAKGTQIPPPGFSQPAAVDSPECEAWRAEAKQWCHETCNPPLPANRDFAERFFNRLNDPSVSREFPQAVQLGGQGPWQSTTDLLMQASEAGNVGLATNLARFLGTYGALAGRFLTTAGQGGARTLRNILNDRAARIFGSGTRVGYPDGVRQTGAIEVKGPRDSLGEGQEEKYRVTAPEQSLTIVGHQCDTEGLLTDGGNCRCSEAA